MNRRDALAYTGLLGIGWLAIFADSVSAQGNSLVRVVVLSSSEVVPNPVETQALAVARVEIRGPVLEVLGAVALLTGPFRDYARDPVDDPALNARLTSAVHLHRGPKGQNGPLVQALKVRPAPDGRSAVFEDQIQLSLEDRNRLFRGELYLDIHTAAFRAGELRGQIQVR